MRIDSHQHFWDYHPVKHSWIDNAMEVLRRDFMPDEFQDVLMEKNMTGCVAVQAEQSEAETSFLLNVAAKHTFIKGVVGWVDLCEPKVAERLAYFATDSAFKGVRHILQSEPDDFMLGKAFCNGIAQLEQFNLSYDILVFPNQLKNTVKLVERFPEQRFVLDHLAKPYIKDGKISLWKTDIEILAKHKNVYCKVSGMVTEADVLNWKENDFKPYMDVVFEAFGTNRIMFGSDWPVCLLAGDYSRVLSLTENYIRQFTNEEHHMIMGKNATDFYALDT
ncbi:MAG: L-fuconolactonase [Maribacter sp.]|jgi:L-fuconolactonase|tara:strand:+ start:559 stop:1389 length:831 start_codon:yes stop_codon:yes gene_type:complete